MSNPHVGSSLESFLAEEGLLETSTLKAQLTLIRVVLGLSPIHDPVEAVRVLHDEGREAFEKLRGARCDHAHEWG
jgi:hypothetical protein